NYLRRWFPGGGEYEAMKCFATNGAGRELGVRREQEKMIGCCRESDFKSGDIAQDVYWAGLFQEELGGIGAIGVDVAERVQGCGLAIVEASIAELRKPGVQNIVIDWTGLITF